MSMRTYTIAVLPGDGIGPEVIGQALTVLRNIADRFGHTFATTEALVGVAAIDAEGDAISDATMELCQRSDAILFGAVGGAARFEGADSKVQPERALFRLRKDLQLFANLRPVRPLDALLDASTIKPQFLQGTDLLVVRELTGGRYYAEPRENRENTQGLEAIDTLIYTEAEIERIVRTAFELARGRRKK